MGLYAAIPRAGYLYGIEEMSEYIIHLEDANFI